MARKPAKKPYSTKGPAPKRAPALPKAIREEPDPEWRHWFVQIEERRRAQDDPKRKPLIFSSCQKDGERDTTIIRRQSSPKPISTLLKAEKREQGGNLAADMAAIENAWTKTVGPEMAKETEIYSFHRGVLTIAVGSSALLQEIRQFHKNALLSDMRDIWNASVPLVNIVYRLGKIDGQRR